MDNSSATIANYGQGYVSTEFIKVHAQFYVDRTNKKVLLGCGDDRTPTEQSTQKMHEQFPDAMPINEGFASMYGAIAGIAKNIIIVGIAQYGPNFVKEIGGFNGALMKAAAAMSANTQQEAIIPALHSAEGNEGGPASLNTNTEGKVGCAYAEGVGATSAILTDNNNPLIREQGRRDQTFIFNSDEHVDELLNGHRIFLETATNGKSNVFAFSRAAYIASKLPVMILAGGHTAAKKSGIIHNFELHKVRNAAAAHRNSKDFYNQDIAIVTAATLQAFPEYNFDPELLMRAYVLDSTPVRAVLAAGDADPELHNKLDARNVPMGVLGDPATALATLRTA